MKKITTLLAIAFCIHANAQIITTIAGNGTWSHTGDGGQATAAELNMPTNITLDSKGNIYFVDDLHTYVRKINTAGIISNFAGNGTQSFSGDGGQATQAGFNSLGNIAFDKKGNMYIADIFNRRVRKIDASGIVTTFAGNGTMGYTGDGGQATAAELVSTEGLACDTIGNVYIGDALYIRKVDTLGVITTIAGIGVQSYSGDGGPATAAALMYTTDLEFDASGNLFVLDGYRVRKINTAGIITTIAGSNNAGETGDGGPATAALLAAENDMAIDVAGNLYIGSNSGRVRMINSSGIINTVAGNGNGASTYIGDGGPATSAGIGGAWGVACDTARNIYISDYRNARMRKVSYCPSPISVSISGTTTVCGGTPSTLTANGATSYTWSAAANNATTNTVSINPSDETIYSVIGINNTCAAADTVTISVNPLITFSGVPIACHNGGAVVLTANGAASYTWSTNAGAVTTNSMSVSPTVATNYTVTGESGGCVSTKTINVSISVPIMSLYLVNGDSIHVCTTTGQGTHVYGTATTYTWMPGNIHTYNFNIPTTPIGTTIYTVTASDPYGCTDVKTFRAIVDTCAPQVGINLTKPSILKLNIYPNPNNGSFIIETNATANQTVEIYDVNGKLILSQTINEKAIVDISNLNSGVYNLSLISNIGVVNKRLVIVK